MTEVKLKELAWQVICDDRRSLTELERKLANGVLTFFDPSFFCKSKPEQYKSVVKQDSRREKEFQASDKGYQKWLNVKMRRKAGKE